MRNSYYGENYDRYSDRLDDSPLSKMRQQFWSTKQQIFCKLKRKEDDHLLASDGELDAKLQAFDSIKFTCENLLRCLERYQDYICDLAHEENSLGKFLKNNGKADKTQAGKIMAAVGRAQSYTAQQRLSLRLPLVRLYQELDVFVERGIADCGRTVEKMEESRTDYRGSLLWMKNASKQLDPDTFRQLEKFRTVQAQVKQNKARFDKLKLDCLQKIDLLSASRCNLFSQILAIYQNTLMTFWDKTVRTYDVITDSFKGYQYYEFKILKTLTDPSLKPKDEQKAVDKSAEKNEQNELISLAQLPEKTVSRTESMEKFFKDSPEIEKAPDIEQLKDIFSNMSRSGHTPGISHIAELTPLLADQPRDAFLDFLNETSANSSDIVNEPQSFASQWENAFGLEVGGRAASTNLPDKTCSMADMQNLSSAQTFSSFFDHTSKNGLLPSDLLDLKWSTKNISTAPTINPLVTKPITSSAGGISEVKNAKSKKSDKSAWYDLFSDVDPLQNPEAFGKALGSSGDGC